MALGASPHCDLLLCPCGNTDTKVYSNPSGSGTARCLGPSLGNGPAFCLISLDDNYSRGPEGLQGKGRCLDVNKLIADSSCEQEALTSYILGKALGKARPERSLHTQFLCHREGVQLPHCSTEVLANLSRPEKDGSCFLPGSCHNDCRQLSTAHPAGLYNGIQCAWLGRKPGEVCLLFTAWEGNQLYVFLDSSWTWGI